MMNMVLLSYHLQARQSVTVASIILQRVDESGTRVRGEIHMLMVGDPGRQFSPIILTPQLKYIILITSCFTVFLSVLKI